ncbi:TIGR03943 family putative permease subunit [Gorillibacterium timonense]|uniref:TIGR03943 family putative permease subunit n=1 Tax=Gorillibacterium timonense TaxID=1689269 RepID=UPI00071D4A9D|nr:TIGR03943 family protein [Gorillibacterium timonense]
MREETRMNHEAGHPADSRMVRHYLFRALLLLAYSLYILYLVQSGNLFHYIAPRMETLVKLAALGLIVVAGAQIWLALGTRREERMDCDCCAPDPASRGRSSGLLYLLFLLPLLTGFLLPDGVSGSELTAVKGISLSGPDGTVGFLSASSSTAKGVSAAGPFDSGGFSTGASEDVQTDGYNEDFIWLAKRLYNQDRISVPDEGYLEVLRAVDLDLDRFVGKTMTISGFVYRDKTMKGDEFAVARLVMSCCAADSSSYGVLVRDVNSRDWKQDEWVSVTGTISKVKVDGKPVLALADGSVVPSTAPANPYVYLYTGDYQDLIR